MRSGDEYAQPLQRLPLQQRTIISFLRGNQLLGCGEGRGEHLFLNRCKDDFYSLLLLLFFEMRSYNALIILKLEGSTDLPV